MARTCIICGQGAGSAEHVFPAALGGRRKNKAIYCDVHNNAYSGLVAELSNQLDAFNALLGVRPDRKTEPKSAQATDVASGRLVVHSIRKVEFTEPRQLGESQDASGNRVLHMSFPNAEAIRKWVQMQANQGINVEIGKKSGGHSFLMGDSHFQFKLGGTEGLRAIAYIVQTYFAQFFADIARSSALDAIKQYTLGNMQGNHARWDFEPPEDAAANRFEFGHRVVVGVEPSSGRIYGRLSFFSTLHFAVDLGLVAEPGDRPLEAVIVDIAPLAEHPPDDVHEFRMQADRWAPAVVANPTDGLAKSIQNGDGQAAVSGLIRKIHERGTKRTAAGIRSRLTKAAASGNESVDLLFDTLGKELEQRVFNLLSHVVQEAGTRGPELAAVAPALDLLTKLDPSATNGLSQTASAALFVAKSALLAKMKEEFKAGTLSEGRIVELIAEGPGAALVGQAVLMPILSSR